MHRRYRLWLLRNRVKGVLHCYCVTGNSRWRLAVESSPAKRHTPTLHDPLLLPRSAKLRSSFTRGDRAFKLRFVDVGERRIFLKRMFLSSPNPVSLEDAPQ